MAAHLRGQANIRRTGDGEDWICFKCNNLNFSFRKKCNRCKVQSREQNHPQAYLDYYYYASYYPIHSTSHPTHQSKQQRQEAQAPITPRLQNKTPNKQNSQGAQLQEQGGLPSVSPLVRRYSSSWEGRGRESGVWGVQAQGFFSSEEWKAEEWGLKEEEGTDDEQHSLNLFESIKQIIL